MRGQELTSRHDGDIAVVAPSADFEMRRDQHINVELAQKIRVAFEMRIEQDASLMRVGDDLGDELVAAGAIGIGNAHAKPAVAQVLDARVEVAMGVMEEALAVGDEELKVANLRMVERGE